MRIVFLDFDGVLNSHEWLATQTQTYDIAGLDPQAVVKLNRLAARADFVICSAWRHDRSVAALQTLLNCHGFRGHVCGKTPGSTSGFRGSEIQKWLDHAHLYGIIVESFVILDDSSDMFPVADRHIHVAADRGLCDEHVDLALKMLGA